MKKVLLLLLVMLVTVSVLPMSAFAESYDVWVNGEQFTSDTSVISCGNGTATYDPVKKELTLDNVTVTGTHKASGKDSGIYSKSDLTIVLKGDNKIGSGENSVSDGIYADGVITLKGNGDLDIKAGDTGIGTNKDVNISGSGDMAVNARKNGINIFGSLTVGGSGKLTVDAGGFGILCYGVTFTGEKTVEITAGEDGIIPADDVEIGGSGDLTITAELYGINVYYNGDVSITGSGKLTITAGYTGIVSHNGTIFSGSGEVEIYGKIWAIHFDNEQSTVRLNGTASPITLSSGEGGKAVFCNNYTSPVAGTKFDNYKCVTGAPDTASVTYRLGHSFPNTWEQHDAGQHKHICTLCGSGTEYADHDFDGNTCKDCGYVKGNTYRMIAGGDGEWTKGSVTGLAFTSDAPFARFDSVQVDGGTVAAANYTAVEGSTEITLAPAYLETLSVGSHDIRIVSNDGSASAGFTVKAEAQPPVTPANYTVTFDMNGHGKKVAAQTVKAGEKAAKPDKPAASGYTFGGWYTDPTFRTAFDFQTAITADITIYARWIPNSVPPVDPYGPKTGDSSHTALWVMLLAISGAVLTGTAIRGRKKRRNKPSQH